MLFLKDDISAIEPLEGSVVALFIDSKLRYISRLGHMTWAICTGRKQMCAVQQCFCRNE